jgi:hypothetical protein
LRGIYGRNDLDIQGTGTRFCADLFESQVATRDLSIYGVRNRGSAPTKSLIEAALCQ